MAFSADAKLSQRGYRVIVTAGFAQARKMRVAALDRAGRFLPRLWLDDFGRCLLHLLLNRRTLRRQRVILRGFFLSDVQPVQNAHGARIGERGELVGPVALRSSEFQKRLLLLF